MKSKNLVLWLVAITTTITVNAQTIALHTSTGVQIFKGNTALTQAYNAAQNSDTLYLSGNVFNPPAEFDKQLTVYGAGHYVDSTLATGKTFINGNVILKENADNIYFEGIEINGTIIFADNMSINQVVIKRCKINGALNTSGNLSMPSNNLALIGSVVLGNIDLINAQNVLISNCILQGRMVNSVNNLFNNNIIMNNYVYYGDEAPINGNNNLVNNNIFINNATQNMVSGNGNIAKNNLCLPASPGFGTLATVMGNYVGIAQASIFINQAGNGFDYAHNYHLNAPATYLGTDGTEVGIYGGTFPYKEGAVTLNPHIQIKNIAPSTNTNGELQIQIQVEAQND